MYFTQRLDHFNFATKGEFQQRYLISAEYWNGTGALSNGCKGPIFFYTGNESPVTDYWDASGLFTEVLAPKHGALLVFAEHRYMGNSLPFGNKSYSNENLVWCTAEQALADYVDLLQALKTNLTGAENCPVIAFGGSYGGMLTYYMKMKYPNVLWGGLAASAPIGDVYGAGASPYNYDDTCNNDYKQASPTCYSNLTRLSPLFADLESSSSGRKQLGEAFKTCSPLSSKEDAYALSDFVFGGVLETIPMLDYPYPVDYVLPLPAWPVNLTCQTMESYNNGDLGSNSSLLSAVSEALAAVVWNASGTESCLNLTAQAGGFNIWEYLSCTEFIFPMSSRGIFPSYEFDLQQQLDECQEMFGVEPDPWWGVKTYGGLNLTDIGLERVIFSNGLLDPWHLGGVLTNVSSPSDSVYTILIDEAAHHLDLRGPNSADPQPVIDARAQEAAIIASWIEDYEKLHP